MQGIVKQVVTEEVYNDAVRIHGEEIAAMLYEVGSRGNKLDLPRVVALLQYLPNMCSYMMMNSTMIKEILSDSSILEEANLEWIDKFRESHDSPQAPGIDFATMQTMCTYYVISKCWMLSEHIPELSAILQLSTLDKRIKDKKTACEYAPAALAKTFAEASTRNDVQKDSPKMLDHLFFLLLCGVIGTASEDSWAGCTEAFIKIHNEQTKELDFLFYLIFVNLSFSIGVTNQILDGSHALGDTVNPLGLDVFINRVIAYFMEEK